MDTILIAALTTGVAVCRRHAGGWRLMQRGLDEHHVTSAIARQGVILAGTTQGVFRSDDLGSTWIKASSGLRHNHVRWLAYHPEISDLEFAGTEPAGIFVSHNGGVSWRGCPEVEALRDRYRWYLPYSPEAGCVRGFAFHGSRAYAAVEVGGVLIASDQGETWSLAAGSPGDPHRPPAQAVHPDVHSIVVHPSSPDLVFAPTGGGFYRSRNGGETWEQLYNCYCRAVWVNPDNADHLILGPADGVDRGGRIEVSVDGGQSWQPAFSGLDAPWPRSMVERFYQQSGQIYGLLSNGGLVSANPADLAWHQTELELGKINALAFTEG